MAATDVLIALYEHRRLTLLSTFLTHPDNVDSALAFAYEKRLAPIFHEDVERESYGAGPFVDVYSVKADFMNDVVKFLDENWGGRGDLKNVAFYKLEDRFGGRGNRIALLHTIEYARISGRFDDTLYDAVSADAPIEANSLDSSFDAKDVHFG